MNTVPPQQNSIIYISLIYHILHIIHILYYVIWQQTSKLKTAPSRLPTTVLPKPSPPKRRYDHPATQKFELLHVGGSARVIPSLSACDFGVQEPLQPTVAAMPKGEQTARAHFHRYLAAEILSRILNLRSRASGANEHSDNPTLVGPCRVYTHH